MADSKSLSLAPLLERLGQNPAALGLLGQLLGGGAKTPPASSAAAEPVSSPLAGTDALAEVPDDTQTVSDTEDESIPVSASGVGAFLPPPPGRDHGRGRRDVLLALRPFLSSRRCASVDRLLRALELYEVIEESRR